VNEVAPSDEQIAAARSEDLNTLIVAPPGCGKTEVLAYRAEHLIPTLSTNQKILALTFTNRARTNLRDRLRQVLGAERSRRFVTVRNFHGHAADVVLSHYRTIGLDLSIYVPPTTRTLSKALREVTGDYDTARDAEALLGEVKRSARTDEQVLAAIDEATGRLGRDAAMAVETARQEGNLLHYDDLLRHAQVLLAVPGVQRLYNCHYAAVLVDEFQDLSLQQLDLVARTCIASKTFAGDPLQGIYSWAGAQPEQVAAILHKACPDPITLSESYRSSPRVLMLVNSIGTQLGATALQSAKPERWPDAGFGTAYVFSNFVDEATQMVDAASLLLTRDPSLSIGVITRSGWRRKVIDEQFAGSDLPIRRWDLAVNDPRILELVRDAMTRLPRGVGFDAAREGILDAVDPTDVDTIEQVEEVFEFLEQSGLPTPRAALRTLRSSGDPQEAVSPGVHLLNAHTGKGQQFDWCFVVGLEENHVPDRRSSNGSALAEEMRVLLVMLSRARHGLVVTSVSTLDGRYGPYAATRSRWFPAIDAAKPCQWANFAAHVDVAFPPPTEA
jgi:DNA helicase-2/ATP-dependent DNA helicase PcrA